MTKTIDFPIKQFVDRSVFKLSQNNSKIIANKCAEEAVSLEEYALTLAMASGLALNFVKTQYPDIWEEIGQYLEATAHGTGLKHDQD